MTIDPAKFIALRLWLCNTPTIAAFTALFKSCCRGRTIPQDSLPRMLATPFGGSVVSYGGQARRGAQF
jgi:hypothetical protein